MTGEAGNVSGTDPAREEAISPELALVDPELARRARAALPYAGAVAARYPPSRERFASPTTAPPGELAAPHLARTRQRPVWRFARRLAAVAALAPVLAGLALISDLGSASEPPAETSSTPKSTHGGAPPSPAATDGTVGHPSPRTATSASGAVARKSSRGRVARRTPTPHAARVGRPRRRPTRPPSSRPSRIDRLVANVGAPASSLKRAFGKPTRSARKGQYCDVTWGRGGITIVLVAAPTKDPCTSGRTAGGFATGRGWRTAKGLAIGASLEKLRRRYPRAREVGSGWWKLGSISTDRAKKPIPLHAHVTHGRIDKLLVN